MGASHVLGFNATMGKVCPLFIPTEITSVNPWGINPNHLFDQYVLGVLGVRVKGTDKGQNLEKLPFVLSGCRKVNWAQFMHDIHRRNLLSS